MTHWRTSGIASGGQPQSRSLLGKYTPANSILIPAEPLHTSPFNVGAFWFVGAFVAALVGIFIGLFYLITWGIGVA